MVDNAKNEALEKAKDAWSRIELSNLSKRERLEREIADIRKVGAEVGKTEAEVAVQIAQARARAAESEKKNPTTTNPAEALIKRLQQQNALNLEQIAVGEKLTTSERTIVQVREELERITDKVNGADRKRILALMEELTVSGNAVEQFEKERRAKEALARQNVILAQQSSNRRDQNATDLASYGRGADAVEQMNRRLDIEREYTQELKRLGDRSVADDAGAWARMASNARLHRDQQLREEENYQQQRAALMGNWSIGAQAAWEDYRANVLDVSTQVRDGLSNAFQEGEDAFVKFAQTGKLSFSSLTDSIIADLARISTRKAFAGLFQSILSAWGGAGASAGATAGGNAFFGAGGLGAIGFAKGGTFDNSPSLSAYSGQIVNKPTLFAFAKGAGLMGEAGPEAIMPLKRTQGGQLGVVASGAGANVKLEVINNGQPARASVSQERAADGTQLIRLVLDAVANDTASGGKTAAAMRSRFGLRDS